MKRAAAAIKSGHERSVHCSKENSISETSLCTMMSHCFILRTIIKLWAKNCTLVIDCAHACGTFVGCVGHVYIAVSSVCVD